MNRLKEISAELLLNLLYPDMRDKWMVRSEGTFYRNYSADVLTVDEETGEVALSRDGFLKLLPQGMLADDGELRDGDFEEKYEALRRRRQRLQDAFMPFDTFAFRRRLRVESQVADLLNTRADYLLRTYYNYDRTAERNPYVRTIALTLPYVSDIRADFGMLRQMIASVTGCEVEMVTGRYGDEDDTRNWLPWLCYDIFIDNLSPEGYKAMHGDIQGLETFINEWFIPFDMKCSLRIKHHPCAATVGNGRMLDYNTKI